MGIGLYSCTGFNSYCVTAKCGVLLSVQVRRHAPRLYRCSLAGELEEITKSILRRNMYLGRVVERRRFET